MRLPKKIVTNKTNDTNIDAYLSILWTINTSTTTALTYDTVLLFDFKIYKRVLNIGIFYLLSLLGFQETKNLLYMVLYCSIIIYLISCIIYAYVYVLFFLIYYIGLL